MFLWEKNACPALRALAGHCFRAICDLHCGSESWAYGGNLWEDEQTDLGNFLLARRITRIPTRLRTLVSTVTDRQRELPGIYFVWLGSRFTGSVHCLSKLAHLAGESSHVFGDSSYFSGALSHVKGDSSQ